MDASPSRPVPPSPMHGARAAALAALGRFSPFGAAALGLFAVAGIWIAIIHHLNDVRTQAHAAAMQNAGNLVRSFDEHISRTFRSIDQTLLYIRAVYARDPKAFDMSLWSRSDHFLSGRAFDLSIIDAQGYLVDTSVANVPDRIDYSDRDYFRAQRDSTQDELFISKPAIRRISGKPMIQSSRRINAADGSFAGVLTLSVSPDDLADFYKSIDVGAKGVIGLVRDDGTILARASRSVSGPPQSLVGSNLMKAYAEHPIGAFDANPSPVDHVARSFAYRGIEDYPLVVFVALAQDEYFAGYYRDRASFLTAGTLLSAVLLLVTTLTSLHHANLLRTRANL
ncbi:MAG TPA: cache domain-containing protein, partial [Stellaceae bacterium]|nr:cache domain-containing protein [Stellaceae bacterium]